MSNQESGPDMKLFWGCFIALITTAFAFITRAKLKEMKQYGLHRHFTGGSSVMMWGGGVKKGHVYGATAEERPLMAVKDPVSIEDLHATIYTIMGINPKTAYEVEKRPFYATKDGIGKCAQGVLA